MRDAGIDGGRLDVEVLLMYVCHIDRTHLYLALDDEAPPQLDKTLTTLVTRRAAGEPIAYLTGHRDFMGLDFLVDKRVLIPRPETEGLVERALRWLQDHPAARWIVDVGTGSGAIAIGLDRLSEVERNLVIVGSDVSRGALSVAAANVTRLQSDRVELVQGDLLGCFRGQIDLVVANLPYLRDAQRNSQIAHEPAVALYSEDAGFALYSALITQASTLLGFPGALLCEIDPAQRAVALAGAHSSFPDAGARVETDLAGRDRYLIVERAK